VVLFCEIGRVPAALKKTAGDAIRSCEIFLLLVGAMPAKNEPLHFGSKDWLVLFGR